MLMLPRLRAPCKASPSGSIFGGGRIGIFFFERNDVLVPLFANGIEAGARSIRVTLHAVFARGFESNADSSASYRERSRPYDFQ